MGLVRRPSARRPGPPTVAEHSGAPGSCTSFPTRSSHPQGTPSFLPSALRDSLTSQVSRLQLSLI